MHLPRILLAPFIRLDGVNRPFIPPRPLGTSPQLGLTPHTFCVFFFLPTRLQMNSGHTGPLTLFWKRKASPLSHGPEPLGSLLIPSFLRYRHAYSSSLFPFKLPIDLSGSFIGDENPLSRNETRYTGHPSLPKTSAPDRILSATNFCWSSNTFFTFR